MWAYGEQDTLGYHGRDRRGSSQKITPAGILGLNGMPTMTTVETPGIFIDTPSCLRTMFKRPDQGPESFMSVEDIGR